MPWDEAREVTFECEPGTLQKHKLEMLRKHGVTRLSLGVENFKPEILQFNGRAHLEEEIYRAYGWARELGFAQINIDLIAGMVGEDWDNWSECVAQDDRARAGQRHHLPDGTAVQHGLLEGTEGDRQRRADAGGRRLADQAGVGAVRLRRVREGRLRGLERHDGGEGQGEDAVRLPRSALARGRHVRHRRRVVRPRQRRPRAERRHVGSSTSRSSNADELPLGRAFPTTERDRLIREVVLQLKTGHLDVGYFRDKYGVDIRDEFRAAFDKLAARRLADRDRRERRLHAATGCCRSTATCRRSSTRSTAARGTREPSDRDKCRKHARS